MALVKVVGINIKSVKVGEADKIITLYTPERGKLSVIAKGARKPGSKFGGRLEPLAHNQYAIATGKSLYTLSQVETIDTFHSVREDEAALRAACYAARLLNASTPSEHRSPALFTLMLNTLRLLSGRADPETAKKYFELNLMDIEGFYPNISGCVKCKKEIKVEPKTVTFSFSLGGLICSSCKKVHPGGITVEYEVIKQMRAVRSAVEGALKTMSLKAPDREKMDLIIKSHISEHIGKDIRNW